MEQTGQIELLDAMSARRVGGRARPAKTVRKSTWTLMPRRSKQMQDALGQYAAVQGVTGVQAVHGIRSPT